MLLKIYVTIKSLLAIFCCTHRSGLYSAIIRDASDGNKYTNPQQDITQRETLDHTALNVSIRFLHSELREPSVGDRGDGGRQENKGL